MGDGVGGPVCCEEKGGDFGFAGVVAGCCPEFEKVEGCEGGEEEGETP